MALFPEHIADLKKSGLSDETISKMDIASIGPDDMDARFKMDGVQSALRFEYLQLSGCSPFHRLKFFPPKSKPDGKVQKYWQPGETGARLYVPEPVVDILRDKNQPLIVCEGEKKAWAAVQAGLPAVAIGGIWNFNDKATDWLIPELDENLKPGREITYLPDSDVWLDPQKLRAVFFFGTKIHMRTDRFYAIRLPVGKGGSKMGLDDFLIEYGIGGFHQLKPITLKNQIFAAFKKQQALINKKRAEEEADAEVQEPVVEINDIDKAEALDLLKNPDLLSIFLNDTRAAGCVGETDNKLILYLTYTSRKLEHPINLNAKGESSAGKNFIVQSVGKFIPLEDVKNISSATPKALFYIGGDLAHKVIVIAEAHGAEDAQYSIRTLQSEKELVIMVPEKVDGRIVTKERKVKGPVAFIETTTQPHLHAENETRCFDIYLDESEEQTKRIHKAQDRGFHGLVNTTAIALRLNLWQNAQRLLEPMPVVIKFARFITFPTKPTRVRRDKPRFMAMIEACALLHQHQRTRVDIHGVTHVVADLDDYEIVRDLSSSVLGRVLSGVTPSCERLVEAMSQTSGEFTQTDIQTEMKWSRPTAAKYANEAVGLGCFERTEGRRGFTHKYRFIRLADQADVRLPTREQVTEKFERFQARYQRLRGSSRAVVNL